MTLVSSSVVMTSPGLMSVPTLTRRRPTRPENGARMTVSSRRALRRAESRAICLERRFELIEARLGQCLRVQQLATAVVLALALGDRGLRRRDIGARLRVVELHEHLAALHALAVAKFHRGDDVGDLGADVDGFVRARVAERLELLADALARAPAQA